MILTKKQKETFLEIVSLNLKENSCIRFHPKVELQNGKQFAMLNINASIDDNFDEKNKLTIQFTPKGKILYFYDGLPCKGCILPSESKDLTIELSYDIIQSCSYCLEKEMYLSIGCLEKTRFTTHYFRAFYLKTWKIYPRGLNQSKEIIQDCLFEYVGKLF